MVDLESIRDRINRQLEDLLNISSPLSEQLVEALRYSVLGGGKRLRGSLVCATAMDLGSELDAAVPAAAAVEFVHAYSLVHDDLPDMDNSDVRRGQLSCHKKFGSTTAILAGDALQCLAFSTLVQHGELSASQRVDCVSSLGHASGWESMVGGQALDMEMESRPTITEQELMVLQRAKTGALFGSCLEMGAVIAGYALASEQYRALGDFGRELGTAFQLIDDVLDATQPTSELGKPARADAAADKLNAVSFYGVERARTMAFEKLEIGNLQLEELGLRLPIVSMLANRCVNRTH